MSREVIIFGGMYLACEKVKDAKGVLTAHVENGGWYLRYTNGKAQARDGSGNVHAEWEGPPPQRLPISEHIRAYNAAIEWAKKKCRTQTPPSSNDTSN